jgi:hypothetical protein
VTKQDAIADVAAGGSILTFLGMSLNQWDNIVHIIAGIVAIIAGVSAAVYHIKKTIKL